MALRTLSLCTGYGGLELALRDVFGKQVRTVCYVERETYVAATLMARVEESALDKAPLWDDLTTFDGKPWSGKVDIITCGFPCQPVSNAGKREMQDDERWIWPDIIRIICEVRPRFVFLENVTGLLSGGLDLVLGDLAKAGFDAEWCSIKAKDVGASHNRLRVFILANTNNTGDTTQKFKTEQTGKKNDKRQRKSSFIKPSRPKCQLADPGCESAQTSKQFEPKSPESTGRRIKEMGKAEQRFISTWFPPGPDETELWKRLLLQRPEIKPSFCRIHDGSFTELVKPFRTERLTMLGNGVVPQQASAAFQILWERMFK